MVGAKKTTAKEEQQSVDESKGASTFRTAPRQVAAISDYRMTVANLPLHFL